MMNLEPSVFSSLYIVKPFELSDVPEILALCNGNPEYYLATGFVPDAESIRELFSALPEGKSAEDKYFCGYYKDGRLIALLDLITAYPDAETAYIGWFMTAKDVGRAGVGSGIIRELIGILKKYFAKIGLGYVKGYTVAERFWKKNGFVPTGDFCGNGKREILIAERVIHPQD